MLFIVVLILIVIYSFELTLMFCYVDSADPVGVLMKTRSSNLLIYIYVLNSLNYIQQVKHSENIGLAWREAQINVGKMTWKQKPYVSAFVNWLKFNTTEINIYHTLYLLNKYTQNVYKRFESVLQMFKYIDWLFLFIWCFCSCIFAVVKTKHDNRILIKSFTVSTSRIFLGDTRFFDLHSVLFWRR